MRIMPSRWQDPGFIPQPHDWSAPVKRSRGFERLAAKQARAIALVPHTPTIRAVTASGEGSYSCSSDNGASGRYCYVIDMGKEIQGGINITFVNGTAGQLVQVTASELLLPSGVVEKNGTDDSLHSDQWLLRTGEQTVVTHEYIEVRYWQIDGAPEPPGSSTINGKHCVAADGLGVANSAAVGLAGVDPDDEGEGGAPGRTRRRKAVTEERRKELVARLHMMQFLLSFSWACLRGSLEHWQASGGKLKKQNEEKAEP
jgi:hypothetical protein